MVHKIKSYWLVDRDSDVVISCSGIDKKNALQNAKDSIENIDRFVIEEREE